MPTDPEDRERLAREVAEELHALLCVSAGHVHPLEDHHDTRWTERLPSILAAFAERVREPLEREWDRRWTKAASDYEMAALDAMKERGRAERCYALAKEFEIKAEEEAREADSLRAQLSEQGKELTKAAESGLALFAQLSEARAELERLKDAIFCEVEPDGESHSMDPGMVCVPCYSRRVGSLKGELAQAQQRVERLEAAMRDALDWADRGAAPTAAGVLRAALSEEPQ